MISILEDLTKQANGRAEFVVQGNDIEELMSAATSNAVLQKAAEIGMHRAGVTDDDLLLGKRGPVASYRRDFVVLASI